MAQLEDRLNEIARLIRSDEVASALKLHVEQIIESPAFSTSKRSGQFLQYIVEKAIVQDTEALKERTIGIKVFHRSLDYDTGEDAVVRVTASDVRKRLAQFYSRDGRSSDFEIGLPPGSYAPEILRLPLTEERVTLPASALPQYVTVVEEPPPASSSFSPLEPIAPESRRRWLIIATSTAIAALLTAVFWMASRFTGSPSSFRHTPWALLFSGVRPLYVVASDPDLNEIQILTHHSVSISEYANGQLGCDTLAQPLQPVCLHSLRGDKIAAVDAVALARISGIAASFNSSIEPHASREIRLSDVKSPRDTLFLGSSRANPWTDLYRDRLDFYIAHDDATGLQVVRNLHPRNGESEVYVPTAGPQGTGENYALISFLPNLEGSGRAMLLGGATHEGTDLVISIVTDDARFGHLLADCHFVPTGSFQILLKLNMMVGSPLESKIISCHTLDR
jgi:hypothetical protein